MRFCHGQINHFKEGFSLKATKKQSKNANIKFMIKGLNMITLHVLEFYEEDYVDIITSVFFLLLQF
jgi:hypothetical protein